MSATAETQEIGKKPATPRAVFILRFTSTIILWTVALLIAFSGFELAFWGLISAFGLISLWEFYGMLDQRGLPNFKLTAMICGAAMLCGSFYYFSHFGLANSYEVETLQSMAYTLFGLLYVLWLFNFMTKIIYVVPRSETGAVMGQFYCLYLIAITKFSDMGAYLTGSMIGRHPLIPHISPKKTWEGFFGAMGFSLLASLALFKLMPGHLAALNWTHATILGLLLGFSAVIGDLAESIIKRSTGVKDSGRLLPGIGRALDLVDTLLITATLLFFYLRLVIGLP